MKRYYTEGKRSNLYWTLRIYLRGGRQMKADLTLRRGTTSGVLAAVSALLVMISLAACQTTPTMSLEEAKTISSSFDGSFVSRPPRGIDDVIAFVNSIAKDEIVADADRALIDAGPPDTDDAITLTRFYADKAKAAGKLGRIDILLPTLRKAAEHVKGARGIFGASAQQESSILFTLAVAEWLSGNFDRGIAKMEQSLALVEGSANWKSRAMKLARLDELARIHGILGDIEVAEGYASIARSIADSMARNVNTKKTLFWRNAYYPHAPVSGEASILEGKGTLKEAESLRKAKIADYMRYDLGKNDVDVLLEQIFLAENLKRQGRLVEAESFARQALFSDKYQGVTTSRMGYQGLALRQLISIYNELGRNADAAKLSKATVAMYQRAGVADGSLILAAAQENLAISNFMLGDWQQALNIYEDMHASSAASPESFSKMFQINVNYPTVLVMNGHYDQAIESLQEMTLRFTQVFGENHPFTMELTGLIGLAYHRSGKTAKAMTYFDRAMPVFSEGRDGPAAGGGRAVQDLRRSLILDGYLSALTSAEANLGNRETIDKSFTAAQLVNVGSVGQTVQLSAARAKVNDPALSELLRRDQDMNWQIQALYGSLNLVLKEKGLNDELDKLRNRLAKLEDAHKILKQELEASLPAEYGHFNLKALSVSDIQASLKPEEALISIYSNDEKTYIWAIPASGPAAFKVVNLSRNHVDNYVEQLRVSLEPTVSTLADIPEFKLDVAYDFFRKLLGPVEKGWKQAKNLIVVSRGSLGTLPLAVLPTQPTTLETEQGLLFSRYRDVPWLVKSHAVTTLPSVATLSTLRADRLAQVDRLPFVGFGDPYFSQAQAAAAVTETNAPNSAQVASRGIKLRSAPKTRAANSAEIERLPRLPDTAREILEVASALKADMINDVFLGERASEARVKKMDLSRYKVISFATHGLVSGDLNGLDQPALALSSPKVTGEKEDGLLTMGEIMGLKLNADWAVLSACNTAAADGQGVEAVSGLGRAFFYAGAKALLVSNWPVHSEATADLMSDLFRRQAADATLSRADALRQTSVHMIDQGAFQIDGKMAFSYAHPIFWAPFTIVGDGGGTNVRVN